MTAATHTVNTRSGATYVSTQKLVYHVLASTQETPLAASIADAPSRMQAVRFRQVYVMQTCCQ